MRLFKKVENFHFCQFWPILATFYEVKITFWKKLVEGGPKSICLFSFSALGYPKSVTKNLFTNFWVNKSLSMMWSARRVQSKLNGIYCQFFRILLNRPRYLSGASMRTDIKGPSHLMPLAWRCDINQTKLVS
jgi:hypothetical protein